MKRNNIRLLVIPLVITIIAVLATLPGCITITTPEEPKPPAAEPAPTPTPISPDWTPAPTANQTELLPSIADVVALVKPSVVAITTEVTSQSIFGQFTQEGAGSGWILDENGIIVTNNHVIEGATSITVTTDNGTTYNADTDSVYSDPFNDLAIIKIDATDLPALKRGVAANLRVGGQG